MDAEALGAIAPHRPGGGSPADVDCPSSGHSLERRPVPCKLRLLVVSTVSAAIVLLGGSDAHAVPSFARQTGIACGECHNPFPELTSFGRAFKLHGYTMGGMEELQEPGGEKTPPLEINAVFPLSVMLQTSLTRTDTQQRGTQNGNVEFPQQLSLFLAGEITHHVGTFLQATYTGRDDHFTLDNTDVRYANQMMMGSGELAYGVTANNNPTLEDLWNSTPAFSFPFAPPDSAPTPAAAALIDGTLAQQVAGLGGYARWNRRLYGDVTIYRSARIGSPQPPTAAAGNNIKDVAPYWRFAWSQDWGLNNLEVGTLGLYAELFPNAVSGSTDKFTDVAFDSQYERWIANELITAHAIYIFENQSLNATHASGNSSNRSDRLHTFRLDGIVHWSGRLTFSLGYFLIHGSSDQALYSPKSVTDDPAQVTGSINGRPNSDGLVSEITYKPWQNVRLSAGYTAYSEFNGRSHNYNGAGRDASDNNTLFLLAWLMY